MAIQMKYSLLWQLLGLFFLSATVHGKLIGNRSHKEDPAQELDQLKDVLTNLGKQLEELNSKIDAYVGADKGKDERRTFDVRTQAAPEENQALQDYVSSLSPEDQLLLQHMKSKVQYLQGVVDEPVHDPNPGEEAAITKKRSEVPEGNTHLQQFASQLSPEDQYLLKKLGARVKFLETELHEGPHAPNPGEDTVANKKKSDIPSDADQAVQDFADQLSPEDQLVLEKLQGRLKFLQGALHEGAHGPNPGEGAVPPSQEKRVLNDGDDDETLQDFLSGLTDDELDAIKHHKDKLKLLKASLKEPKNVPNPGEEAQSEKRSHSDAKKAKQEPAEEPTNEQPVAGSTIEEAPAAKDATNQKADQPATDKDVEFTAEDRVLLKAVSLKLEELRQSLEAFKEEHDTPGTQTNGGAQVAVLLPATIISAPEASAQSAAEPIDTKPAVEGNVGGNKPERRYVVPEGVGRFGAFVDTAKTRVAREFDNGWHEEPIEENSLGLVEVKCVEGRGIDCDSPESTRNLKHGDQDSRMNLRQLLRALRKVKDSGNQEAVNTEDRELDNIR